MYKHIKFVFFASIALPIISNAQDKREYQAPDVNIISVTPVQGSGISLDRVSNIQDWSRQMI